MGQRNRRKRRQVIVAVEVAARAARVSGPVSELDFIAILQEVGSPVLRARTLEQAASALDVDVDVVARADQRLLFDLLAVAIAERAAVAGYELGRRDGRAEALQEGSTPALAQVNGR